MKFSSNDLEQLAKDCFLNKIKNTRKKKIARDLWSYKMEKICVH